MSFFAEFTDAGTRLARKDTRFYFCGRNPSQGSGNCIGTIIMCNPGGAKGPVGIWTRIIKTDPTLDSIEQILRAAVALKRDAITDFSVSPDDYVQILNCCYICDTNPPKSCLCGIRESVKGKWAWVAWGDKKTSITSTGVATVGTVPAFWFEQSIKGIRRGSPVPSDIFPIHPLPVGWRTHHPKYATEVAREIASRL